METPIKTLSVWESPVSMSLQITCYIPSLTTLSITLLQYIVKFQVESNLHFPFKENLYPYLTQFPASFSSSYTHLNVFYYHYQNSIHVSVCMRACVYLHCSFSPSNGLCYSHWLVTFLLIGCTFFLYPTFLIS